LQFCHHGNGIRCFAIMKCGNHARMPFCSTAQFLFPNYPCAFDLKFLYRCRDFKKQREKQTGRAGAAPSRKLWRPRFIFNLWSPKKEACALAHHGRMTACAPTAMVAWPRAPATMATCTPSPHDRVHRGFVTSMTGFLACYNASTSIHRTTQLQQRMYGAY
jgi:hypothetical protein